MGLVTGTELTKLKVAVGEYNGAIDKRIAEIQQSSVGGCPAVSVGFGGRTGDS